MLTKDISLEDAILDLIDNCIDGIVRSSDPPNFANGKVAISLSSARFAIEDNCGGIDRDIAATRAFRFGREAGDTRDEHKNTIGMYGVGMKRSVFKLGQSTIVSTRHLNDSYTVTIGPNWLASPEWTPLPIDDASAPRAEPGTTVVVEDLYPGVRQNFENPAFIDKLRTDIGEHFTTFLQRGMSISVNGSSVKPVHLRLLVTEAGPCPYVHQSIVSGVRVTIAVGMSAAPEAEDAAGDDEDEFARDRGGQTAGWTVLCNDRAVLVGDKNRVTGWGDGIPLYHPQFSTLTGIVEFSASATTDLPVTTTKRALDTSSDVWLSALVKMKEGMRVWTSHTNKWKNHARLDQYPLWVGARAVTMREAVAAVAARRGLPADHVPLEYNPAKEKLLESPPTSSPSSRRITFSRPREQIAELASALLDDATTPPGRVGEACFDQQLAAVRRGDH
jgi:hypothetical protein